MDKFDRQIIALLSTDARQSNSDIARAVGLSRTAVSKRVNKLEESGEILGYRAILPAKERVAAYFHIAHSALSCESLVPVLRTIPEIKHCHSTLGEIDMTAYVEAADLATLEALRCQLLSMDKIDSVKTSTIIKALL
ncbi:MAG: Lrp/AsnC family transcriptional regulator [Pseudomonadales bacterium]